MAEQKINENPNITQVQPDISFSSSTLSFFNENIYSRIEKAMQPISIFIKKMWAFKKKYDHLLKSLGYNYDQHSFAAVNRIEIENRDPDADVPYDSSMDSFFNKTESLGFKILRNIEFYFPLLNSSQNTLKHCIDELDEKIKKLQNLSKPSSSLSDFVKLKDTCLKLAEHINIQQKLLTSFLSDLVKVNKILASDGVLNEETADQQKAVIHNYIFNGLTKECNQTVNQANTFLRQEKTNRFINKLVLVNTQCHEKNLAFGAIDGFIKNLQKMQQQEIAPPAMN